MKILKAFYYYFLYTYLYIMHKNVSLLIVLLCILYIINVRLSCNVLDHLCIIQMHPGQYYSDSSSSYNAEN
jgi:hypothetical protein